MNRKWALWKALDNIAINVPCDMKSPPLLKILGLLPRTSIPFLLLWEEQTISGDWWRGKFSSDLSIQTGHTYSWSTGTSKALLAGKHPYKQSWLSTGIVKPITEHEANYASRYSFSVLREVLYSFGVSTGTLIFFRDQTLGKQMFQQKGWESIWLPKDHKNNNSLSACPRILVKERESA